MPTNLINNIERQEAAIAFIDSISRNGDISLVAAAKNGNRKAFEILVKRHQQRIFFVARRITRTREDAEDVVQQSFQKAFTHLAKFEGRSTFSVADTHRGHRSPHVLAETSRVTGSVDRRFKGE